MARRSGACQTMRSFTLRMKRTMDRRTTVSHLLVGITVLGVAAGCVSTGLEPVADAPGFLPSSLLGLTRSSEPGAHIAVDRERSEVVLTAGPFTVPSVSAEQGHHGHGGHGGDTRLRAEDQHEDRSPLIPLAWPVDGWMRGFSVALFDGDGGALPRGLLHHLITVNFDRRQVVYPVAERLFGVGEETTDVILPGRLAVPLREGSPLGVYASWHNDMGRDLDRVYLEVRLPFEPVDRQRGLRGVLPIYMDVNNVVGGTNAYDLSPGPSERAYEFEVPVSGRLLGVGGHLHDHGVAVRLEDAETGEVLARVKGIHDDQGRLVAVERKVLRRFFGLLDASIHLEAGRRYRVVGVYDNPLDRIIPAGAMAHMVGVFQPDEWTEWTELDRTSALHQADLAGLPEPLNAMRLLEGSSPDGAGPPSGS